MRLIAIALLALTGCTVIKTGVFPRVVPAWSSDAKGQRADDCWKEWERTHVHATEANVNAAFNDPDICDHMERYGDK